MDTSLMTKQELKEYKKQLEREETLRKLRSHEETPFLMRMKYKYLTFTYFKTFLWKLLRLLLLLGLSYIILMPYFSKISSSFMSRADFVDSTVSMIPRYPTLATYKAIINDNNYFRALFNTTVLSLLCGVVQTLTCAVVGYGLAKFKFKGKGILFLGVVLTMIVPHETIKLSMYTMFRYFDIWGIVGYIKTLLGSSETTPALANFMNTYAPLAILSFTGLAFKNGLFIFIMRQYFNGVPDELEEAAYVDGAGVIKTFIRIILPMSIPMLVTIFMFSFSWQWTDVFYNKLFFINKRKSSLIFFPDILKVPKSLDVDYAGSIPYTTAIYSTAGLLIMAPLVIIYMFAQRTLIEGIERSGITG